MVILCQNSALQYQNSVLYYANSNNTLGAYTMHILWELIGLFVLGIFSIMILAFVLLMVGFFGFYETHNILFGIPFALGLMLASAVD